MPKTISGPLATHLASEVTTIATIWRIIREDATEFYFTDHDKNIVFEGNTYLAAVGYNRTAVESRVGLAVDNLDVEGFLESTALTEGELRAGLFDFAEVRVSVVNWDDLSQGALKMRRGRFGEVKYSDDGTFSTELRGLAQAYSQQIVETYQPECRVDLGDAKCMILLTPPAVARNTAFILGQRVRAASELELIPDPTLLVPADTNANDTSINLATGTVGSEAQQQTTLSIIGAGALEFTPTITDDPSASFVSYPDISAYSIGSNEFTIEAHVRLKALTSASGDPNLHVVASQYTHAGDERAWFLRINTTTNELQFFLSDDGTFVSPALTIVGAFTWVAATNYHIAVTRDATT